MRTSSFVIALAAGLLMGAAAAPLPPAAEWKKEIGEANIAWAKAPHAILKIQDAAYLGEGQSATLTGTAGKPDSYKWVPGKMQDGIAWVTLHGGKMSGSLHGKPLDDATLQKSVPIDTNVDIQGFQTQVSAGVIGVRVMLYNQLRADALRFTGVEYFPYDPSYRITATFKPDPKLPPRVFRTSRGTDKQFFHAGDVTFTLKGKTFTLPFYSGDNDPKKIKDASAFFTDDQAGTVTYPAGRYVDIDSFGAFPPKTVTIDFNFTYNPNCARSAFYTCPVATDVLAMAVQAGEKGPAYQALTRRLPARTRLMTWWFLGEDRDAVLSELAALNALHKAEPKLHIVPGHDLAVVSGLETSGVLKTGFDGTAADYLTPNR